MSVETLEPSIENGPVREIIDESDQAGFIDTVKTQLSRPPGIFWCGVLLAFAPFLIPYLRAMWNQELYQYFPFLLIGVFGLAYARSSSGLELPRGRWSISLLLFGLLVLAVATLLSSSWLGAVAFVIASTAFLSQLKGGDGRRLTYLALPLLMFIRLPQLRTQALIVRLQMATTEMASVVLDLLGIPHDNQGNTIELASKQLFVDEACSGVRSLFTLCFLALLLMVYRKRSILLTPLYLLIAVCCALLGNMMRVTAIAVAEAWFQFDLSTGILHDFVGYIALGLSILVLWSFDSLVEFLFHPVTDGVSNENPIAMFWNYLCGGRRIAATEDSVYGDYHRVKQVVVEQPVASSRLNWPFRVAMGAAILCGAVMTVSVVRRSLQPRPNLRENAIFFEPTEAFLSGADASFTTLAHDVYRDGRESEDQRLGKNADVWRCDINRRQGEFVLSQPYVGWHELTICYLAQRWQQTFRQTIDVGDGEQPIVYAEFQKDGSFGALFFAAVNADGNVPRVPDQSRVSRWFDSFIPLILDDYAEISGSGQTAMIQYWTISGESLERDEIEAIAQAMARVRRHASERMLTQGILEVPEA